MKLTITRAFSKTKQIQSFEPINSFCSIQAEYDETLDDQLVQSISQHLDILVLFLAKITIGCRIKYIHRLSNSALSHVKLALCSAH